ncbi:hypothetical protein BBJ28_00005770 [Nothophytophthora sp. Chile5]|nr:hypothetical protein BBJ28_00005770 [Nothophytophthora sp. Chile5]
MAEGATLLRGHKFYLARTLSRDRRKALLEMIQTHGGEVVASPIGATQLVECEMLDARQNWVAAAFVEDSVAFGALQDPAHYTGAVFAAEQTTTAAKAARRLPRGRRKFTPEDDARMLHFVKVRARRQPTSSGSTCCHVTNAVYTLLFDVSYTKTHHEINWQTMGPVPKSVWNLAEKQKVRQDKSDLVIVSLLLSFIDVLTDGLPFQVTTHSGSSMHEHFRKQLRSKTPKEQRAIMAQALVGAPFSPLGKVTGATSNVFHRFELNGTGTQPLSKKQQKQKLKRKTSGEAMENKEPTSPLQRPEGGDSDVESNESSGRGDKGVFFESVWTNLLTDPSKRLVLQRYFGGDEMQPQGINTNTALAATYPKRKRQKREGEERGASQTRSGADLVERGGMQRQSQASDAEQATELEADAIICQLQLETNQDMPSVVHALFYSSGDAETARAFLKGASPTGIWSPGDDLLLVNLMAEGVDRSAVDEAVARGDFAAMRVPRDTEEIVARIRFLL